MTFNIILDFALFPSTSAVEGGGVTAREVMGVFHC